MKLVLNIVIILLFSLMIIVFLCKKETSYEGCNDNKNNKPPISVAGPDQVITSPNDSVCWMAGSPETRLGG